MDSSRLSGAERDRTANLHTASVTLAQLSYGPKLIVGGQAADTVSLIVSAG